jgi:hypothetical protein
MAEILNVVTPLLRRWLYGLTNWGLLTCGMANLVIGTWYAAHAESTIAATSLTAGLVLLLAATIDRFESLKGLGMEAKTRALDEKIEQADEALRKIKQLAELTGYALINFSSKMGRWDSAPTPRESFVLAKRVRTIMHGLGSEQSEIALALRPWAAMICGDLATFFHASIRKKVAEKMNEIIMQRSSLNHPEADNPDLALFNQQIKDCEKYTSGLLSSYYFELEDYPERFMTIFDNPPSSVQEEIQLLRNNAVRFAEDMSVLKKSMTLQLEDAWISTLEEARSRG